MTPSYGEKIDFNKSLRSFTAKRRELLRIKGTLESNLNGTAPYIGLAHLAATVDGLQQCRQWPEHESSLHVVV